jgi:hypothetical protein
MQSDLEHVTSFDTQALNMTKIVVPPKLEIQPTALSKPVRRSSIYEVVLIKAQA